MERDSNQQSAAPPSMLVPMVIESSARGERAFDIFSLLLRQRIVMLGTPVDDPTASLIVAQLLYLDSEAPDQEIRLYINSPGGSVTAGLAIYDTMKSLNAPVSTVCIGFAASMATILLAGGSKGQRYSLPNATIHMHPAAQGMQGYAPDVEIMARELLRKQQLSRELLARDTGQPIERIARDFDRDLFMTPSEAREYGIVDMILTREPMPALEAGGKL